ncbi:uncharacterized protein LOC135196870 isoform X1 [Macrobrachium nipponense]|uniref:uncharacterized protein LOC135196870 isoform X1 n=1 Tax=Macrobrachium nipponense TaxID=159736 RepID=UPI0030C7F35B
MFLGIVNMMAYYFGRFPPTLLVCLMLVGASQQQGTETTAVPPAVDTTTGNSISEGVGTETTAVPPAVDTTTGNSISEGTISWTPVKLESPAPGGPVPSGALDSVPVLTALGPEARNLSGCCLDGFRYDHGCPAVISGDPNICTNGEWILQGTTTVGG